MRHVLVITPEDAAGTIWTTGFLRALATAEDDLAFTVKCPAALAFLFEHMPNLHRLVPQTGEEKRLAELAQFTGRRWHRLLDFRDTPQSRFLWTGHRHVLGDAPDQHRLLRMAAAFDRPTAPPPQLWLAPNARAKAMRLLPDDRLNICFAPALLQAGEPAQNWPLKNFAELAWRLASGGGPLAHGHILLLGPQGANLDAFANNVPAGQFSDFSHLTLPEIIAVLARAQFFIGDGGLLAHLAAAAGLPVLSLFPGGAPAEAAIACGPHCRYLFGHETMENMELVAEAARDLWQDKHAKAPSTRKGNDA